MKSLEWILLAVGGYLLYSHYQLANVPPGYPGGPQGPPNPYPPSRSTGSGGTIATGGGTGTSAGNPPISGIPGNPTWSTLPTGVNQPGGPIDSSYVQCMDGSYTLDPSTCPENAPYVPMEFTCADGSIVADSSQCPEAQGL